MQLIPRNRYFLKWSSPSSRKLLVLDCQFITNFDATYRRDYNIYSNLDDASPAQQTNSRNAIIGKIIDAEDNYIEYPFQHPFHPYNSYLDGNAISLFKVMSIVKVVVDGEDITDRYSGDIKPFRNVLFNTLNNTDAIIIPNKTMLWVDMTSVQVMPNTEYAIVSEKADTIVSNALPHDMVRVIREYEGGAKSQQRTNNKRTNNKRKGKGKGMSKKNTKTKKRQ